MPNHCDYCDRPRAGNAVWCTECDHFSPTHDGDARVRACIACGNWIHKSASRCFICEANQPSRSPRGIGFTTSTLTALTALFSTSVLVFNAYDSAIATASSTSTVFHRFYENEIHLWMVNGGEAPSIATDFQLQITVDKMSVSKHLTVVEGSSLITSGNHHMRLDAGNWDIVDISADSDDVKAFRKGFDRVPAPCEISYSIKESNQENLAGQPEKPFTPIPLTQREQKECTKFVMRRYGFG